MPELEKEYASRTVLELTTEVESQKRALLNQELAAAALKVTAVEAKREAPPVPITATVKTAEYKYSDSGYYDGYVPSNERRTIVRASYFATVYLGALAKQASPILTPKKGVEKSSAHIDGYQSVHLDKVTLDGDEQYDYPIEKIRKAFDDTKEKVFDIVRALRENVEKNNPYKDIPIRINWSELIETLLRFEILRYCEANDPNFHIEEIENH